MNDDHIGPPNCVLYELRMVSIYWAQSNLIVKCEFLVYFN